MRERHSVSRRHFLAAAASAAAAGLASRARAETAKADLAHELARVAAKPALDVSFVKTPVRVTSLELLRNGSACLVRARSADGAEAVTVPHQAKMSLFYPVFNKLVAPFFVQQDARDLEHLLWGLYRNSSTYKMQGMALWVCVAAAEMALLEAHRYGF